MFVQNVLCFYQKISHQVVRFFTVILLLLTVSLGATPQYNIYDPAIVHTVYGTDKFYKEREKSEFTLHISPFYQHTTTASQQLGENQQNGVSNKVPIGNRLGRWNMVALYYNPADTIPTNSPLGQARTQIIESEKTNSQSSAQSITLFTGQNFNLSGVPSIPAPSVNANLIDESTAGTIATVAVNYERLGVRGQVAFDFAFGLGMSIKGGVVDYKQAPTFTAYAGSSTSSTVATETGAGATTVKGPTTSPGQTVLSQLNTQGQREAIAQQFGLNLSEQRLTTLEDTHVGLHWSIPFKIHEKEEHVYTMAPYFSIGAWIPTGSEFDQNKAFSVATGNDGFPGGTAEFSLNFDFPKMLQIGFGAGAAFFGTRTLTGQRVPTSELQVGIIPWKTTITKRPGPTWYFNVSLNSEQFTSGFSFYFDYIFTQHIKDSITLQETNSTRLMAFQKGVESMVSDSSWKAQHFNLGFKYDISSMCSISLGAQGYISGIRSCRVTTVLGSVSIAL